MRGKILKVVFWSLFLIIGIKVVASLFLLLIHISNLQAKEKSKFEGCPPEFSKVLFIEREKLLKKEMELKAKEEEFLELLKKEKAEVAVGLCHLGNPLVRGVDLPEVLRYANFLGVPKHTFPLVKGEKFELSISPQFLYNLLLSLMPLFEEEERLTAISHINYLKRYLALKEEQVPNYEGLYKKVLSIKEFLEKKLNTPEFIKKLEESDEVFLERDEKGNYLVIVGNSGSYLQASGRVSRLTTRGLLPGLSVILVDNFKALRSLQKRLRFYLGEEVDKEYVEAMKARMDSLQRNFLKRRQQQRVQSIK